MNQQWHSLWQHEEETGDLERSDPHDSFREPKLEDRLKLTKRLKQAQVYPLQGDYEVEKSKAVNGMSNVKR